MSEVPAPLPGTERRCRLALGVEYDGTAFHGWQRLAHADSVQGALEAALATIVQHEVEAVCAGRTDAGVHGAEQVVHLETDRERSLQAFVMGTNTRLPPSVRVLWAQPVASAFHARHSARARRYRYRLLNRRMRPALQRDYLSWEPRLLDAEAMHRAAQTLVGEHDFNAFRSAQCQAAHARRDLHEIHVSRHGDEIAVEVQANAFLHHMVRNIVGSLLMVGRGERPVDWVAEVLAGRDRTLAGPTASPGGLVFLGPRYPVRWGLPASVSLPADWVERPRPLAVLPDSEQDA